MKTLSKLSILISFFFILVSCNADQIQKNDNDEFKKNSPDFNSGVMTPEILWSLGRISEISLSPDKTKVLFGASFYSIEQNKSKRELYVINLEDNSTKQISDNDFNEYSPTWRPDGEKIAYLAPDKKGVMQIWEISPNGYNHKKITSEELDVTNFRYAPTNNKILFTKDVKIKADTKDLYPDLPDANAKIITDLMYHHWDTWEDEYFSHVFVADYDPENSEVSNIVDVMPKEPFDVPIKPFDGVENINFSPDGNFIAYSCKKKEGTKYALSTNSEIYLYIINSKKTLNISTPIEGYDKNPVFSHSGDKIAWESMERDGFEADKIRIMVKDLSSGETIDYTKDFDQNASQFAWADDDSSIYFICGVEATYQLFNLNLGTKQIKQVTKGIHDYVSYDLGDGFAISGIQSMSSPVTIYKTNLKTGAETQLSFINKDVLSKIKLGRVEKRWITTTDKKQMLTWVIYPPDFDSTKIYPTLLYCEGGPQSAVSQFFSYRWNFQIMAANGYIIVAPNRRGLPTFGQQWNDQISKDYGGQNMQDYLSAIDEVSKEPYVDKDHRGAVGASYGGLSIYWLAGHHQKRFKAFIAHDGIFDFVSMYGTTEELWFVNWDLGGPYWNPTVKNSYSASPNLYVKNWDTPILIVQGGQDLRVPEGQAFEAFTAAKLMGLDAELLYFPEENHWVLKPQNGILWQREFFKWLDKYLK